MAALIALERPPLGPAALVAILGSAVLHLGYFVLLSRGYRFGDLSLVYPLARGSGPLLATALAISFFGERPSLLALAGAGLIGLGGFVLAGDPRRLHQSGAGRSVLYALLTGLTIAAYTLWDKRSVSDVGVPPLVYFWGFTLGTALLLGPLALRERAAIRTELAEHGRRVLAVGLLVPLAYVLVLTALATSPVSYVAPAREIGILFGAILGTRLLAEGDTARRLAGAAAMVVGVGALAVG